MRWLLGPLEMLAVLLTSTTRPVREVLPARIHYHRGDR